MHIIMVDKVAFPQSGSVERVGSMFDESLNLHIKQVFVEISYKMVV